MLHFPVIFKNSRTFFDEILTAGDVNIFGRLTPRENFPQHCAKEIHTSLVLLVVQNHTEFVTGR